MHAFSFLNPAKTCAGRNALEHLPFELGAMGASKPMVIPDAAAAGVTKPITRAFAASGITLGISSPVPRDTEGDETAVLIRTLYDRYREKGFDAIIALGGTAAAEAAKALNIAVSLGPEALKRREVSSPLSPLVYLPTGTDAMGGATAATRFNGRAFASPHLSPGLVMIDPKLMVPEERGLLLDRALICLALACEVFSSSPAPPARAYAATAVSLARSALEILLASGLKGPDNLKAGVRENALAQEKLVQAAVMAGYLSSCPGILFSLMLGEAIAARGSTPQGQVMAMVLPAILESRNSPALGRLYLHLSGAEAFSAVPAPQQSQAAVQEIRKVTHRLFSLSHGLLPRTLSEAGWASEALEALGTELSSTQGLTPEQNTELTRILACAWDGRPLTSKMPS